MPDSMPRGVEASPEYIRSAEGKNMMPDSSADDSPHTHEPQVTPTFMAGVSHRPNNSRPAVQTSEFGGNTSSQKRGASPSNLNRSRYSSYDSDVWNGGCHRSGTNSNYTSRGGMTSKPIYGNRNFGIASSPPAKPLTPKLGFILKPKHQQFNKRGVNMVQASSLSTKTSNKWTASSAKVVKGQYNTTYNKVSAKTNELDGGGDSKIKSGVNIELTVFPAPSLPEVLSPHMIGFQNHGNSCYLNASLQALLGLPMLVTDAVNLKYAVDKSGWSMSMGHKRDTKLANEVKEQQVKLVIPFLEITQAREYGEVANVTRNIDLLKAELEQVDNQFVGNKMQDANEFLCRLIDSMKENIDLLFQELSPGLKNGGSLKAGKDDGKNDKVDIPNLVNSNFLSEREETFQCLNCKRKTSKIHTDLNFYCSVERFPEVTALGGEESHVPLQKLIDKTFETDEVRERRCKCGHNLALTTNRLVRLPRVLVLHLKRYDYEQGERSRKISRPVSLPAKLNLAKYVVDHVEMPNCQVVERLCLREPAMPHPTLALNSRKRARVESDDNNHNLSSLKVQGVDMLDANNQCFTPVKFRGKTAEEIEAMGYNDKVEYTMHMSMKSAPATTNYNIEDENLAAAIKASLVDKPANRTLEMDLLGDDTKMEAPKTEAEEEQQILEALQLSLQQETSTTIDKSINNNQIPTDNDYRLVSVVSHYGATTSSGHYVADVYSFDQGSWFRYNDSVVTPINELNVTNNSNNTKNGYIFMYIHEALAQQYDMSNK